MAKTTKNSPSLVPKDVLVELNAGRRETRNLVEGLAIDLALLLKAAAPELSKKEIAPLQQASGLGITQRMRMAAEILLQQFGIETRERWIRHPSDTVQGWGAFVIGLHPDADLQTRLDWIRPLADDPHFGVREWAWMPMRTHIAADLPKAIALLKSWVQDTSTFVRRYATEATRPRGVWTSHIQQLKEEPELGLPLLEPLSNDPEKYVQDSVANWLNDATKSQPKWVQDLCNRWRKKKNPATDRICQRALRSLKD